MTAPSPGQHHTVEQVEEAIRLHRNERISCDTRIAEHLAEIDTLRRARAAAVTRMDQLLEQRNELTARRCPDTPAELDTPGDRA